MSTVLDIVKYEVERTNDEIARSMPKDKGDAANSLHIEVNGGVVNSVGSSYIEYLDRGSAPWNNPDQYKKLGYILDQSGWADRHSISPYAVAYSIAHNGSLIYQGKKQGIELDQKLTDLTNRLKVILPKFVKTEIKNSIKR